jgi:hypothetical protein
VIGIGGSWLTLDLPVFLDVGEVVPPAPSTLRLSNSFRGAPSVIDKQYLLHQWSYAVDLVQDTSRSLSPPPGAAFLSCSSCNSSMVIFICGVVIRSPVLLQLPGFSQAARAAATHWALPIC